MMYKTKKIKLTPISLEDSLTLFNWINDKDLVHFNSTYRPIDLTSHNEWFDNIRKSPNIVIFAIRKMENDELVGSCQLHSIHSIHHSAELQIRIGKTSEHSKGFGSDAVKLLLEYGFSELNLNKIYLHVFSDNFAAIKVYEKCGFITEGLLRENNYINGIYKDVLCMSILKNEYSSKNNSDTST